MYEIFLCHFHTRNGYGRKTLKMANLHALRKLAEEFAISDIFQDNGARGTTAYHLPAKNLEMKSINLDTSA